MKPRQLPNARRFTTEQRTRLHRLIDAIESVLDQGREVVPYDYPAIRAFLDYLHSAGDRCTHCPPPDYRIVVQDSCDRETIAAFRSMADCQAFSSDAVR
jgi:hypothetical protein